MTAKAASTLHTFSQRGVALKDRVGILELSAPFVLGFICIYMKTFASSTYLTILPDAFENCLLIAGIAFLLLHIISKSKSYGRRFIPLLLVLLSTVYTYYVSGETAPLSVSLIVIAAATAGNTKSLVSMWFVTTVSLTLFAISAYGFTAILAPNSLPYVLRWENGVQSTVRFTFFFSHPNTVAAIAMMMCGAYMYLNYDRLRFRTYAVVLIIDLLVFLFTDSKTSTVLIAFLVVCFVAQKQWGIFEHSGLRRFIAVLPIVFFGLVYVVAGPLYRDSFGRFLTGRVSLWHYCLENQGLTMFGQHFAVSRFTDVNGFTYYYETLDCAYASGLLVFGLCFSAFFCWCVYSCVMRKDGLFASELPLILAMLVFGITEVHIFSPVVCGALLLLSKGIPPSSE